MASKIVVVGAGLVGGHLARLLAAESDFDVTVVDVRQPALDALASGDGPALETACVNILEGDGLESVAGDADLVVGAVPGAIGLETVRKAIGLKKRVVDISFSPEDPFLLREAALEHGVPVVVDCGLAPGISNLCAARGVADLQQAERVLILVGGLPTTRRYPFDYQAVFSPGDVIEEYTRPARYVENDHLVIRDALTDVELHEFERIGTLESFNTDGLRTLMHTLTVPHMKEKTLRFPGHAALMLAFRTAGFFDSDPVNTRTADGGRTDVRPVDVTLELFHRAWARPAHETEFSVLRVEVDGTDANGARVRHQYDLLDHTSGGVSSMARTTATPAALVATRIARGELTLDPGVYPPELLADVGGSRDTFDGLIADLAVHDIRVQHQALPLGEAQHALPRHRPQV